MTPLVQMVQATATTSLLDLILQAGWVGQSVLFLLSACSILVWAFVLTQWKTLRQVQVADDRFIQFFLNAKNLKEISTRSHLYPYSLAAHVFRNGIKEWNQWNEPSLDGMPIHEKIDPISRVLLKTIRADIAHLEKSMGWLATVANTAPFIGLFGTVWGIMNAFQKIGLTGMAQLSVVAPGISEALITTAAGIGTAIPAAIFYNYFVGRIRQMTIHLECFSQDLINKIQRNLFAKTEGSSK